MAENQPEPQTQRDEEMERIVGEEQRVLRRVLLNLTGRQHRRSNRIDYDQELVSLRDQIAEARLEDVPALVAQMERLAAGRRAPRGRASTGDVDTASPYFGRMRAAARASASATC